MNRPPHIIRDNFTLFKRYPDLGKGDIICCRIRLRPGEEHLLLDLSRKKVRAIPSLNAQLCSRSKTYQTRLFSAHMYPHTRVIYNRYDLMETISLFEQQALGKVVLKQEGKNGGIGIFLFNHIEELYAASLRSPLPYPFVVQPFIDNYRDIRVIILDDYVEAYERESAGSFRQNLHCGGVSRQYSLSVGQLDFCKEIMSSGEFPYAHIDLALTDTACYLAEINLRGGLKGAALSARDYQQKISLISDQICEDLTGVRSSDLPVSGNQEEPVSS